MKNACLASVAFGALVLAASVASADTSAPPAVDIKGSATPICWSGSAAVWQDNPGGGYTFLPGTGFTGGAVVNIDTDRLVNAENRAINPNLGSAGAFRARFPIQCNAPVTATLQATNGRFLNTSVPTLPTGLNRVGSQSAPFENYFPYVAQFGFVNTVTGAQPPSAAQIVNGANGYRTDLASSLSGPPSWPSATTGDQWFNVRRVDIRFDLNALPNAPGGVSPVMIAGSYQEVLRLTVTPGA